MRSSVTSARVDADTLFRMGVDSGGDYVSDVHVKAKATGDRDINEKCRGLAMLHGGALAQSFKQNVE